MLITKIIIPINSKDEGNQLQSFNQFQQIDFTLSQSVQQLINLKVMLCMNSGLKKNKKSLTILYINYFYAKLKFLVKSN